MSKRSVKTLEAGDILWLERGLFARKTKSGEIRYGISYMAQGRRIREMVGTSVTQARNALAKRRVDVANDRCEFPRAKTVPTLADFCDTYLKHAKQNKRSWQRDEGILARVQDFFGGKRLDKLTTWDIELYKAKRAESVTKATVNRELAIIKRMLRLAVDWGVLDKNPAQVVKLFKEEERPIRALDPEEQEALLAACSRHLFPIVALALNTGMRRGEIFDLRWEHVDMNQGLITVAHNAVARNS